MTNDSLLEIAIVAALTNNYPLPGSLKPNVRSLIQSTEEHLAALDKEIPRIQALLDDLRRQHANHSTQIKQYRISIAPHRDLPGEILSEIFLWSLPEWGVPVPKDDTNVPWNIVSVCSAWRQLALSMPRIWTRVDLSINRWMGAGSFAPNLRTAKELIGANSKWPLSIRANFGPVLSQPIAKHSSNLLSSNIHRLREVFLRGHPACIESFLNLPAGIAKSLEIVTVSVDRETAATTFSVLKNSPRLRELIVNMFATYPSIIQLPLAQLTVLHLPCSRLRPQAALSILRQCASLNRCTLGLSDNGDDALLETIPCLLPELTHLTLRPGHHTLADYPQCIEALTLPRLTHLCLKDFYPVPQWPASCTQVITRSGCLQSLKINVPISNPHLQELLEALPSLTSLSISRSVLIGSTLEGMASGALVPEVRTLVCAIDTQNSFCSHLDMLEHRKLDSSHAAHIAEVTFMNKSAAQEFALSGSTRYKDMVNSGWKINVMRYR